MQLESTGILINLRAFNERDSLAHIFTRDYGTIVGMMRGAIVAKKNKPLIGQFGTVVWNARLDDQLGVFHWDSIRNMAAPIMFDSTRLSMMNAAFAFLTTFLPEREKYTNLFESTVKLLSDLGHCPAPTDAYISWETILLRELGYALDLTKCAGCGGTTNLSYLSPRTYRAVCANCGAPYSDKLYKLPMNIALGRQLLSQICALQGTTMPSARIILDEKIQ